MDKVDIMVVTAPIGHKTVKVSMDNGTTIEVDERIADLIVAMNRVGLKTEFSCEGDQLNDDAYISIDIRCLKQATIRTGRDVLLYWPLPNDHILKAAKDKIKVI